MSIIGIFSQKRPSIGVGDAKVFFDATLYESSELVTDVTRFPVETGSFGNDHAVLQPLRLTMVVGISDNIFRALRANENNPLSGGLTGLLAGAGVGVITSKLSSVLSAASGVLASVTNAAYAAGQASTRSQTVLDTVRNLQRTKAILDVVTTKTQYSNMIIVSTRQETVKENEQGLELVIEFSQLSLISSTVSKTITNPSNLPARDTARFQAQPYANRGEVVLR